jgi:hypothetical protein
MEFGLLNRSPKTLSLSSFLTLGLCVFLVSCEPGNSKEEEATGGDEGLGPEGVEKPYNATPIGYRSTNTTIVSGTAQFQRFDDGSSGLETTSTRPIRFAEVHILNSSGSIIQAGETDGSGNFYMLIPMTAGTYTLSVNSRADNSSLKVSVLDTPIAKAYYSLLYEFNLVGSETTKALTVTPAPYNGTLEGGAFNILDNVLIANEFLRSEVSGFTTAPKIPIYWKKGLSPYAYFGFPNEGISFFAPSSGGVIYRGLYILGGIEGSICVDTDHFDNSVILHEYGHYLEDAFSLSSSPGGSHDGNSVIDPRLAWSEGWANFFQATALGRRFYRDTSQNADCSGSADILLEFNLELKGGPDVPVSNSNEGIFRELSITRTLFDIVTGSSQNATYNLTFNTDSVSADLGFERVWSAFESIGGSNFYFQNAGQFHETFASSYSAEAGVSFPNAYFGNFDSVLDHEEQVKDRSLYGDRLSPTTAAAATCSFNFSKSNYVQDEVSGQVVLRSNNLTNNDFYEFYWNGDSTSQRRLVQLFYEAPGGGTPFDLDLYVYQENYVHLDSSTIRVSDEDVYPESPASSYRGWAVVDFTGLPAGIYMINVKIAYTTTVKFNQTAATTTYYLQHPNGEQLCP